MDENSQILDVTYGNFSCRLEGFEDSVETMKLVVSYFHELAGHDRFMDTEPQAPDMATLARLTEDEVGQPVDVEGAGNKVSLRMRPSDIDAVSEGEEDQPAVADPDEQVAEEIAEEAPVAENDDDLSGVAEKLQRMREAAGRKVPAATDDFAEDLSEPVVAAATNPLSQRLSELVKRTTETQPDDVQEMDDVEDAPADDHDMLEADVSEVAHEEIVEDEDTLEADDINVFSDVASETETPDTPIAHEYDFTAQHDEASVQDVADELAETSDADDDMAEDDAELDAFMAEEDDQPDAVADDEMIVAEDEPETVQNDNEPARAEEQPLLLTSDDKAADDDEGDDDDDDEFDLEREVAKVEAEIAARKGNEFARRGLPRHVEDAMSRIMSQTDQHLNQPENRRHRDAFAQLKAAVAATEAARQLGDNGADKRHPDDVYKDDLGAHEAKDKGEGKSAPPLKLVKSQEVKPASDVQEQTPETPATESPAPASSDQPEPASARLRQIATQKEAVQTGDNVGFADFVASHGATDLADQMEAAGAYICFVQGETDFSRPQVMKVVQSASDTEISREDGLRSFGRLLRQARLVKLANGRFQVADNTQYRPDGHHAAQG